jgi:NADPH-dependent 2,4-dienoyl-CoA reductase/sulfur reductase-like enzyme
MNIRTDTYGGKLENRMRFVLETIDAVRTTVGSDFVVGSRFTADEFLDWTWWSNKRGNTIEEGKEIAKKLADTGNLNYLFPCAGSIYPPHVPPMYYPLGAFAYLAAEIKKVVNLPVFTIGRINDPVRAEEIISGHQADMVGMFRGLVADPEFVKKTREGRAEEIRRCIGCCEGCTAHMGARIPLSCTVNVQAGREKQFVIQPAENKKKVMIVGAGGAGLETARVAALRGHEVSLYEKEDKIAKDLTVAAKAPGRDGWEDVIRYYTRQMSRLKVDVHLNVFITPEMVQEMQRERGYDAVVIATGATPYPPQVPGKESAEVTIAEARSVLEGEVTVGEHILIVAYENHSVALTTADFLSDQGKTIEIITESLFAGPQLDISTAETLYSRLLIKGVVITPLTGLKEIQGKTLVLHNVLSGVERNIKTFDTVVMACERKPNDALYHSLKGKVKELCMVGQCLSPRRLIDSIFDGAQLANRL